MRFNRRYPLWYSAGFAVVNMAEALVILLTVGLYSPGWLLRYVGWYTKRYFKRKIAQKEEFIHEHQNHHSD